MKKSFVALLALSLLFSVVSCEQFQKKGNAKNPFDLSGKMYSVEAKTTTVFWTGYKTTAKTPVKGQFAKVDIANIKKAKTAREAINGITFSIPVSSLFSKDEERDSKLKEFLFGVMDKTEFITGIIHVVNDSIANADVRMNAVSHTVPLKYFIDGQMMSMDGNIDLSDWKALDALASLHKACEEKHTGDDGVSKTWSEVGIHIVSYLKVE